MQNILTKSSPNQHIFQNMLMEYINEGIMAVSQHFKPVYLNSKAREICQQIWNSYYQFDHLPSIIHEISRHLIKNSEMQDKEIAVDHHISEEQIIRIRACNLVINENVEYRGSPENFPWVIIFLQDRSAILQQELLIEQQKYNLSDRETQVLRLLSQAYTYQEIAQKLQISLNTVKFHVKNVYAKKRGSLEYDKRIFVEITRETQDYSNV